MSLTPSRGNILVRTVETEERLSGARIILPDFVREKWASHQMEVLGVGHPEVCEDEDCDRPHGECDVYETPSAIGFEFTRTELFHPIDERLKPGAWVFVAPRSLVDAGDVTDRRYFCRADDVLGVFVEED